jgi:hypothetical protein
MARRLIVTAGWLAAAVLAVLVGLLAVNVIGDGLTSGAARTMSEDEVARALENPSATPPASAGVGSSPAVSGGAVRTFTTPAGTVVGRCAAGRPEVVSMSPAQGYSVHDRDTGPQSDDADGEFRRTGDGGARVEFEIVCAGGVPALALDG